MRGGVPASAPIVSDHLRTRRVVFSSAQRKYAPWSRAEKGQREIALQKVLEGPPVAGRLKIGFLAGPSPAALCTVHVWTRRKTTPTGSPPVAPSLLRSSLASCAASRAKSQALARGRKTTRRDSERERRRRPSGISAHLAGRDPQSQPAACGKVLSNGEKNNG
jgi:hypothetical protein